jgi:endoglucanase
MLSTAVTASLFAKQSPEFVSAQGKELIGPDGKPLFLRGINLGNWLEPEGYMFLFEGGPQSPHEIEEFVNELIGPEAADGFWTSYRQAYITAADIQFLKRCGFNSVRIPLHWKFFTASGKGFDLLDPIVAACREAGLFVVLDMHCAPGGQTGTNIDDSWGYPWLYDSPREQELLIDVWVRIARHYRDEPTVLGYDLLNEPIPHYPQLRKFNSALEPLYKRVTRAIRAVDARHVIILGGAQWDSNFDVFGPPFDSNLLYQLHKYWMPPVQASVQPYVDFRNRYSVPLWLGESGENDDAWIAQFRKTLEANNIGWCFWPYKKLVKTSCVVSVKQPGHWDQIVAFARMPLGTGNAEKRIAARPSPELCREALEGLLRNVQFEACAVNTGYLEALGLTAQSKP